MVNYVDINKLRWQWSLSLSSEKKCLSWNTESRLKNDIIFVAELPVDVPCAASCRLYPLRGTLLPWYAEEFIIFLLSRYPKALVLKVNPSKPCKHGTALDVALSHHFTFAVNWKNTQTDSITDTGPGSIELVDPDPEKQSGRQLRKNVEVTCSKGLVFAIWRPEGCS